MRIEITPTQHPSFTKIEFSIGSPKVVLTLDEIESLELNLTEIVQQLYNYRKQQGDVKC